MNICMGNEVFMTSDRMRECVSCASNEAWFIEHLVYSLACMLVKYLPDVQRHHWPWLFSLLSNCWLYKIHAECLMPCCMVICAKQCYWLIYPNNTFPCASPLLLPHSMIGFEYYGLQWRLLLEICSLLLLSLHSGA